MYRCGCKWRVGGGPLRSLVRSPFWAGELESLWCCKEGRLSGGSWLLFTARDVRPRGEGRRASESEVKSVFNQMKRESQGTKVRMNV